MKQLLGKSGIDIELLKQLHEKWTWNNKRLFCQCPLVLRWMLIPQYPENKCNLINDLICMYIAQHVMHL